MKQIDKLFYSILAIILIASTYYGFTDPEYFNDVFTKEDGAIEYSTALFLMTIGLCCLWRLVTIRQKKKATWVFGTAMFVLLFFFGAGEEISWGQRLFNIESSEFFLENNAQKETNLHNLVVADKKINKIIFSQLLMVVMLVYLLLVPFLYRKKKWVVQLIDNFAVPVVKWHHTIAFIAATIVIVVLPNSRKWEVYELAFGMIFLLIFLHPLNKKVFIKSS